MPVKLPNVIAKPIPGTKERRNEGRNQSRISMYFKDACEATKCNWGLTEK
jgi:hypothetical protein